MEFYELVKRVNAANGNHSMPFMIYEEWMVPQLNKYYDMALREDEQIEKGIKFVKNKAE